MPLFLFNLGARWEWGSTSHPGRFTPAKETRYPLYREAGWAPGPVWTGAKNIAPPPTGIRSPDRPARSESLYRLSCPSPQNLGRFKLVFLRKLMCVPFVVFRARSALLETCPLQNACSSVGFCYILIRWLYGLSPLYTLIFNAQNVSGTFSLPYFLNCYWNVLYPLIWLWSVLRQRVNNSGVVIKF